MLTEIPPDGWLPATVAQSATPGERANRLTRSRDAIGLERGVGALAHGSISHAGAAATPTSNGANRRLVLPSQGIRNTNLWAQAEKFAKAGR